jgi:hypothetical protein
MKKLERMQIADELAQFIGHILVDGGCKVTPMKERDMYRVRLSGIGKETVADLIREMPKLFRADAVEAVSKSSGTDVVAEMCASVLRVERVR